MKNKKTYDVIGIGIGPFNLGLAALLDPVKEISALFLDQSEKFDWHPGLMLNNATLQVPFMADLVTMADPKSRFSFLNFLKEVDRLYKFFIREDFFILRKEYNIYCRWVVDQLTNCLFNQSVETITYDDLAATYEITVLNKLTNKNEIYWTKKIVLGTGTQPSLPDFMNGKKLPNVIHASEYLNHKAIIQKCNSVSIIGSGQSAAEIFQDLLSETEKGMYLSWFTRPDRFFPMEYSKLTLELTSPEYIDYFYQMSPEKRKTTLAKQPPLYKGINFDLINDIYDSMYEMSVDETTLNLQLRPNCQLDHIQDDDSNCVLTFTQVQKEVSFTHNSDFTILATGYKYKTPVFIEGILDRIHKINDEHYEVTRNYSIGRTDDEIFIQNGELNTHGFVTPDLGMGAYRNAIIINTIAKKEIYKVERSIAFQQFDL